MASIDLDDVSLSFHVRQRRRVTFKEFFIHHLFRSSANPYIEVRALDGIDLRDLALATADLAATG